MDGYTVLELSTEYGARSCLCLVDYLDRSNFLYVGRGQRICMEYGVRENRIRQLHSRGKNIKKKKIHSRRNKIQSASISDDYHFEISQLIKKRK